MRTDIMHADRQKLAGVVPQSLPKMKGIVLSAIVLEADRGLAPDRTGLSLFLRSLALQEAWGKAPDPAGVQRVLEARLGHPISGDGPAWDQHRMRAWGARAGWVLGLYNSSEPLLMSASGWGAVLSGPR